MFLTYGNTAKTKRHAHMEMNAWKLVETQTDTVFPILAKTA